MKPFRCYFLGKLGIFLFAIVYTGNLTITVFEMIIQSLGSIKLLFLQFNKPLFYWWFFSRGEQRRRKRFWPAVLHLTTLRGQARRFLSLSKIVIMKIKTNRKDSGFSYSWPFYHRQHQFNVLFLPCTCAKSTWRESAPRRKPVQFTVDHGADGKVDIRAFVPFNQSCIQPSSEKAPIQKVHSSTSHSGKCFYRTQVRS